MAKLIATFGLTYFSLVSTKTQTLYNAISIGCVDIFATAGLKVVANVASIMVK